MPDEPAWPGLPPLSASSGTDKSSWVVPVKMAVTKEAPVNPMHPDFGAKLDGIADDTAALKGALAFAATASQTGSVGEVKVPAGMAKISSRLIIPDVSGLQVAGAGATATIIKQMTDNEPVFEMQATGGRWDHLYQDLQLTWNNQQVAASTNAVAFRLLTNNINGFWNWRFRNLRSQFGAYVVQWGPNSIVGGAYNGQVGFWNNEFDVITTQNVAVSLLQNSSTAVGGPTNWVNRWTHTTQATAPTSYAFAIGSAGQWEFSSLDVEDWTGGILYGAGGAQVGIRGLHLERHHLAAASTYVFTVSQGVLNIEGGSNDYYFDDPNGPYYFAYFYQSRGRVGGMMQSKHPTGNLGAGQLRNVVGTVGYPVSLFGMQNNDANIVDYSQGLSPVGWLTSYNGGPPIQPAGIALPAAAVAYRNLQVIVPGANAATADTFQQCMQSSTGTYSWKTIATG